MSMNIYHLHTQTVLHCGTGQSVGLVDQPIARDRASQLPIVPGSTMRGVLRHSLKTDAKDDLFGPIKPDGSEGFAGALSIGDAHLLLLPVRSVFGIVAYATCPFILKRYAKDRSLGLLIPAPADHQAMHTPASVNVNVEDNIIVLEELDLASTTLAKDQQQTQAWAERISQVVYAQDEQAQKDLQQRFLILPDNVFAFLAETAMEIRTRIRINPETGIVAEGQLWSEEYLPPESVLWGVYSVTDAYKSGRTASDLHSELQDTLLQIGGNAGTGSGLVQFYKAQPEQTV